MKISASSYSFQKLLDNGTYTQLSLIAKVKEMGFDAIEFVDIMTPSGTTDADFAKQLRTSQGKGLLRQF